VLGAGATGAYIGAALARGGADVVLVARGEHLDAMQQHGVQVRSPRGDFSQPVVATDSLDALVNADVVFVALKAHTLPQLASELSDRLRPETTVIAAQNGVPWWYFHGHPGPHSRLRLDSVDPDGIVSNAIDPASVIGCVIYCSTEITSPGVINHIEGTRFAIGEPDGTITDRCRRVAEAVVAGGLKCPIEPRIREHIWLKLVGNVAFNPVSVLTGATMGEMGAVPETRHLLRTMMSEAAAVAAALEIELPVSLDRRLQAAIAVGDHRTSMLQDYQAGKPLEFGCLTGAVVELADQLDVDIPAIRAVHACVKLIETHRKPPTRQRGDDAR